MSFGRSLEEKEGPPEELHTYEAKAWKKKPLSGEKEGPEQVSDRGRKAPPLPGRKGERGSWQRGEKRQGKV